jgi:hypothetical protein
VGMPKLWTLRMAASGSLPAETMRPSWRAGWVAAVCDFSGSAAAAAPTAASEAKRLRVVMGII